MVRASTWVVNEMARLVQASAHQRALSRLLEGVPEGLARVEAGDLTGEIAVAT